MAHSKQESRWVLLAQCGDREALGKLFEAIQIPLHRYIAHMVGRRAPAADVLQDVFVVVHKKLRWLREPEFFRTWVFRVATREVFARLRRERAWAAQIRDEAVLEALPAREAEEVVAPELLAALPRLVERLSPSSRAVVVMHYVQGMSIQEVADVLAIPQGTAKSRLAYGLATLRAAVGGAEK